MEKHWQMKLLLHHCRQHIYCTIAKHKINNLGGGKVWTDIDKWNFYCTIAAYIQHNCSTFTALLLNTKLMILEEEKSELNWCYLFEGLIEIGKVKKEFNKTWHKLFWSFCHKLYISNTEDILVLLHTAQFQHILVLSSSDPIMASKKVRK